MQIWNSIIINENISHNNSLNNNCLIFHYPNTKSDLHETISWTKTNVPSMLKMFGTRHWFRERIS
jgi:spore cortex formation protein SpoVR/YcgB (stage V sporulation)